MSALKLLTYIPFDGSLNEFTYRARTCTFQSKGYGKGLKYIGYWLIMRKTQANSGIPDFGLYGESSVSQDPGFVHIEDIAARSREVGWLIKPHRHDSMLQILCIFDGGLDVQLDDESHTLSGGCAITIPPGVVHGFRFKPDTKGAVLSLAAPLFNDESYRRSRSYFDALLGSPQIIKFQTNSVLFEQLRHYL
ncbi:MAG: hypothetical protein DRR42_07390, partial [Gammaproteobacteria bacterium]